MRKSGRSRSFLERARFYEEWNNYFIPLLVITAFFLKSLKVIFQFLKYERKGVSKSIESDDRNFSSVKPQQIFISYSPEAIFFSS